MISSYQPHLPPQIGLPDELHAAIDAEWSVLKESQVAAFLLENRVASAWGRTGEAIANYLIANSLEVYIFFDGFAPLPHIIRKIEHTTTSQEVAECLLRITRTNDQFTGKIITDYNWQSVHKISRESWIPTLWNSIESHWFNQASDMIMTFIIDPIITDSSRSTIEPLEALRRALNHSSGWMVPLDGNLGFLVGCPSVEEAMRAIGGDIRR
jgi:hypothetical protein